MIPTPPEPRDHAAHEGRFVEEGAGRGGLAGRAHEFERVPGDFREILADARAGGHWEIDHEPGLIGTHDAQLSRGHEELRFPCPAVDLALDRVPEVVAIDGRDGEARLAEVARQFEQIGIGERRLPARPVVLLLHQNDGSALALRGDLKVAKLIGERRDVAAGSLEEGRGRRPQRAGRLSRQPRRDATEIPPTPNKGARSEDDVQPRFARELDEPADVGAAREIERAGPGLAQAPEYPRADGGEPGEAGGVQSVGPFIRGDQGVVDLATDEHEPPAIDHECSAVVCQRCHGGKRSNLLKGKRWERRGHRRRSGPFPRRARREAYETRRTDATSGRAAVTLGRF